MGTSFERDRNQELKNAVKLITDWVNQLPDACEVSLRVKRFTGYDKPVVMMHVMNKKTHEDAIHNQSAMNSELLNQHINPIAAFDDTVDELLYFIDHPDELPKA